MSMESLIHIAVTVLGWGIGIGVLRQTVKGHGERLEALEKCELARPKDYVLRTELEAKIETIKALVQNTNDLIRHAPRRAE